MAAQEERCIAWEKGRCSRDTHPQLHGTAAEAANIPCCSILSEAHPNFHRGFTTCPFARKAAECIYAHQ